MASQDGIFKVSGSVGNVTGVRKKNGKLIFRKKAEHVNRSEAAKLSAIDFGSASAAAKIIRYGVKQLLNIRTDDTLVNRLNKVVLKALYASSDDIGNRQFNRQGLAALAGFQFNEKTGVQQLLPFMIKVKQDGKGNLRIPLPAITAKDIRHAKNTSHIEIKAIAAGVNFREGEYSEATSDKVMYDFREPATEKELVLPFKAGAEETIVVLQITAYSEWQGKLSRLDNMKFFAADIIDVIPSLPEEGEEKIEHHVQSSKQPLFQVNGDHTFATPQKE